MDFKDSKAIYVQIADYFYEEIINGKLHPGERIPSVRDLAMETEVNPNTVMRTYQYLQEQNIIFNKRGMGYYLAEEAPYLAIKIKKEEFIKNSLPDFFKNMKLLNISVKEIESLFSEYIKTKQKQEINKEQ